jgi:anti-sigma regulatory factor (Ser/Thr protein kinase)
MMMRSAELLSLQVPCDREAPGVVREALTDVECPGWVLGDVMLVASELVTNAVLHSGCWDQHLLDVEVQMAGDRVNISVRDPGLSGRTARPVEAESVAGGWGLRIVAELSQSWGTDRGDGYRVWAEVPSTGSPITDPSTS